MNLISNFDYIPDINSTARKPSDKSEVSLASFDYEKSIWGYGNASLSLKSPTSFRLRQSLKSIAELKSGAKVLELGCGAGQFIREIKKIRPDLDCYGCDISQHAIALAKQADDGVSYDLSTENNSTYADNFFDAVLIFDVLEHVENPSLILSEVNRVLKSGGVFYSFVPCEADSLSFWNLLYKLGLKKELTRMYAGHINKFSRKSLVDIVQSHGFAVKSVRYSEQILGQLLGLFAFFSMDHFAKKNHLSQVNNEQYFYGLDQKGGGVLKVIKNIVNSLVALESIIFSKVPSPNVHLTVVKK
ncbi:MAG TPA: class I SAM-dependent methyltransferase [Candidatus Udaeobacter sp.]|nr:class I SAM-dependent methyltransferase [Candidatus Udaeobacter sp.]